MRQFIPSPRRFALPVLFAALFGLAGCGSDIARSFGLQRDTPDEFVVTARAPLSMPPSYMIQPPRPGASRPQELATRNAGEAALVPQLSLAPAGASSPGQQALLQATGPAAPADIRARVDEQAAVDAPNPGLTDKLLFWRAPKEPGILVDPQKEAQRLRENAALGQNNQESETSIITPKRRNIFGF